MISEWEEPPLVADPGLWPVLCACVCVCSDKKVYLKNLSIINMVVQACMAFFGALAGLYQVGALCVAGGCPCVWQVGALCVGHSH